MSPESGVEIDADVTACSRCASPVFHDELYCEACGWRVSQVPDPAAVPSAAHADRDVTDLGVIAAVTDRGRRRQRNEDAFAISVEGERRVAAVCDGVASTANSDQAARAAASTAMSVLRPPRQGAESSASGLADRMNRAFHEAQQAVLQIPDDEPDGNDLSPSTTMTVAVAVPGRVTVANIGDSRAYWLGADGSAVLLTVDDSWAQEQIAEGMAPEAAYAHPDAHTITRWVGADADSVLPSVVSLEVMEPGVLVLCTDGLWNYFEEPRQLRAVIPDWTTPSPMAIAERLADAALAAGGQDNITVVVTPVGPARSGTGTTPTKE